MGPTTLPPRVSAFSQTQTLYWSTGELFNGFALIGLVTPTSAGTPWVLVAPNGSYPGDALPDFMYAPIVNGKWNQSSGLFYNSDLTPPNSRYVAWYYDLSKRQLAGPTSNFAASTATITLPELPLTSPAIGANPVPD